MNPVALIDTARFWAHKLPYPYVVAAEDRSGRTAWYAWTAVDAGRRAVWLQQLGCAVAVASQDEQEDTVTEIRRDYQLDIAPGLSVRMDDIIGQTQAILGMTGSGKSMTVRRLIEQLLDNNLPLAVFDIAGEYHTLRERFDVIVFGREPSDTVDLPLTAETAPKLASLSIRQGQPVVIDLSGWSYRHERIPIVVAYLQQLWTVAGELRRPYHLVLEEAHHYIPQSGTTDASDLVIQCAAEGRKRGLGIILASQRSARIDKDVLTQAVIKFLHYAKFDNDIKTYSANIPSAWMKPAEVEAAMHSMTRGEALVVNDRGVQRVKVLPATTTHVGYTPGVDALQPLRADRTLDEALIARFAAALGTAEADTDDPSTAEIERLRARVAELEAQVAERDAEITKLKSWLNGHTYAPDAEPVTFVPFTEGTAKLDDHRLVRWPEGTVPDRAAPGSQTVVHITGHSPLAAALRDNLDEMLAERDEDYRARMIRKQEREFADLQRTVRAWIGTSGRPTWQRDFVHLLRKHGTLSKAQAINWLRIAPGTFSPPRPLIAAGLVRRDRPRTNPSYTWTAPKTLAARFPDLDAKDLEARLVQ